MKTLTAILFLTLSLFAVDGQKVFEENCKACHLGMVSKADFKAQYKTIKAPPMVVISNRLKNTITIKDDDEEVHRFVVVSFIKEYLKRPSWSYYLCDDAAINRFDVMPAQTHLSDAELQAVAEWVFDEFEDKEFK
ncbi:MAG: cytochrome c [Campylobacterota bacterium]